MPDRPALAALAVLIVLHATMLLALFFGVEPHPPARVAPFGMAPFLAATVSAACAAMIVGPTDTATGRTLSLATMALTLVSFGPQKLLDPALPLIWPALATAWLALAALALRIIRPLGQGGAA